MDRRQALQLVAGVSAAATFTVRNAITSPANARTASAPVFTLPPLGYAFDALEPHIDAETMRIHYERHHAAYVRELNVIASANPSLARLPMARTLRAVDKLPEGLRAGVRHNMGGHWNHSFFWPLMAPGGSREPHGPLKAAIEETFGSVASLQERMGRAARERFGSGWVWLGVGAKGELVVFSTPDQDTPHMVEDVRGAVLGIDLWEHAYYLKYNAERGDYLSAWWRLLNWDKANEAFGRLLT